MAEQLGSADPSFGYANLAIRGRKLRQIMAEQVDAAVELKPTLVSIYAGANDILRPKIDIDALLVEYDAGIRKLKATGATVVMFTGFDARGSKIFGTMRGRTAIYNELVRGIAGDHGALLVDYWRFSEYYDWGMWATDRMHMSAAGHANMAKRVLTVLEHEHSIDIPPMTPVPELSRAEAIRANARWVREFAAPWVVRRVTGNVLRRRPGAEVRPAHPPLGRQAREARKPGVASSSPLFRTASTSISQPSAARFSIAVPPATIAVASTSAVTMSAAATDTWPNPAPPASSGSGRPRYGRHAPRSPRSPGRALCRSRPGVAGQQCAAVLRVNNPGLP